MCGGDRRARKFGDLGAKKRESERERERERERESLQAASDYAHRMCVQEALAGGGTRFSRSTREVQPHKSKTYGMTMKLKFSWCVFVCAGVGVLAVVCVRETETERQRQREAATTNR